MLDPSLLIAPAQHGGVLVVPDPREMTRLVRSNAARLSNATTEIAGDTFGYWRRRVREWVVGEDGASVIVTGHQPAMIHAGVWAKHVVAARLAQSLGGIGVNLVVDNDEAGHGGLDIPIENDGRVERVRLKYVDAPTGFAFEQIPLQSNEAIEKLSRQVEQALGDRFQQTQMPSFFRGLTGSDHARDWVDQVVAGRRAIEIPLGIELEERRVSDVRCQPLLGELLLRPEEFRAAYNRALRLYRSAHNIRGQRPMPDLERVGDAVEVPFWVYHRGSPRRRLFVVCDGRKRRLLAGTEAVGVVQADDLYGDFRSCLSQLGGGLGEWQIRPRALALTLWARLFLADLFVHGIGGAKYDQITDTIIQEFFGIEPPAMACVSATLRLDLPLSGVDEAEIEELKHRLRDLRFNPQRHLPVSAKAEHLIARRALAVKRSVELREAGSKDRAMRREVFEEIRRASRALLEGALGVEESLAEELSVKSRSLASDLVGRDREYFFGLHTRESLEYMLRQLPNSAGFGV